MKKTALALAVLAGAVAANAQDTLSATLDTTYASSYIFRGEKWAEETLHPSVELTYGDFYAGAWAALPFGDNGLPWVLGDEIDLYAGYTYAINDQIKLDVGLTNYWYTDFVNLSSNEAYVGVNGDVSGISLGGYVYYNFDNEVTTYQGTAGYSLPVEQIGTSLDFSATLGYVASEFKGGADSYTYYGFGVSIPYSLSDKATFTVGVNYSNVEGHAKLDPIPLWQAGQHVAVTAGLSIGF